MRPAKERKLTSGGEVFFFAGTAKSYAQGLLSQAARVNFRNSGIECDHDSAAASSMEDPVAQTKNFKTWKNFHCFGKNFPNLGKIF